MGNGNDPVYLTNREVADRMIRGNAGDVESPMSAREQRRLQERAARLAGKREQQQAGRGVQLHTPEQVGDMHCRRLWGVLGTAAAPVVHYCTAPVELVAVGPPVEQEMPVGVEHKRQIELQRQPRHDDGQHRCGCGTSSHDEGARLVCRFRETGQQPCGRAVKSVENTALGQRSMPCGHPVKSINGKGKRGR